MLKEKIEEKRENIFLNCTNKVQNVGVYYVFGCWKNPMDLRVLMKDFIELYKKIN